jgi:hypothetical protein
MSPPENRRPPGGEPDGLKDCEAGATHSGTYSEHPIPASGALAQLRDAQDRALMLEAKARALDALCSARAYRLADGLRLDARLALDAALTATLPLSRHWWQMGRGNPWLQRREAGAE